MNWYRLQSVPLDGDFGLDAGLKYLPVIEAYFRARKPHAELEQIAAGLEEIRKAILANFKLEDVLLRVKDKRLPRRDDSLL